MRDSIVISLIELCCVVLCNKGFPKQLSDMYTLVIIGCSVYTLIRARDLDNGNKYKRVYFPPPAALGALFFLFTTLSPLTERFWALYFPP